MTPVNNHAQTFHTPTHPAGYALQAYQFNTDDKMSRMLEALTGVSRKAPKKTKHASAPRKFTWEKDNG